MGFFRPYERTETAKSAQPRTLTPKNAAAKPALKSKEKRTSPAQGPTVTAKPEGKKAEPTPTRKAAEAARMERLHPTLSKRQARKKSREASRVSREEAWQKTENSKERKLLRDFVDSRWTVAEFLLPAMLVFLAATMSVMRWFPQFSFAVTAGLWFFMLTAIFNIWMMWRSFKVELADRYPNASKRGLVMYMVNRSMMFRRFRQPRPAISRGDSY